MTIRDVRGFCPMGCGPTLHLMPTGFIQCLAPECPDRGAVSTLLADAETEHIVDLKADGTMTLQHPLRERIQGSLFDCDLLGFAEDDRGNGNTPRQPGRYRVTHSGNDWSTYVPLPFLRWEAL